MLIPSYAELMKVLNDASGKDDKITSRYTIVIAAAKRARQIIDGDEPMVESKNTKSVSTAVEELYANKIKVVPEGEGTVVIPKRILDEQNRIKEEALAKEREKEELNKPMINTNNEMSQNTGEYQNLNTNLNENININAGLYNSLNSLDLDDLDDLNDLDDLV